MNQKTMLRSRTRHLLSVVFVAWFDRFRLLSGYLSERRRTRKKFPGVALRTHWDETNWGEERLLCLTDPFDLPLSSVLPTNQSQHPTWLEIRAFREGEPAITGSFNEWPTRDEGRRRVATLALLRANPDEFSISIANQNPGGCCLVVDGHHRLAIAEIAGRNQISVKVVFNIDQYMESKGLSSRLTLRWFLFPFSIRRAS